MQEACAEWVAVLHYQTTRDPALTASSSAPSGGTAVGYTYAPMTSPPAQVARLLAPYRRHVI